MKQHKGRVCPSPVIISEWDDRRNRAIERAIKQANFRHKASIEDLNFSIERGLDKNQVQRLADLSFISQHKDVFITGSTGTGKTYLATLRTRALLNKNYWKM